MGFGNQIQKPLRGRRARWAVPTAVVVSCIAIGAWLYGRSRVEWLATPVQPPPQADVEQGGQTAVRYRGAAFVTKVATFRDELFAYLMYQHFRSTEPFPSDELLLCYDSKASDYQILLVLSSDIISTIDRVAQLHRSDKIEAFQWTLLSQRRLTEYRNQARLFVSAYNLPVKRQMEDLTPTELRTLLRRFIRFKSTVDPRVRKRLEPVPTILSSGDAQTIAADIVAVAEFYELPLELLLGIGAMENNYMNIRGDLKHTIWKRRPAKDDIVLERRRGRVRVLNDSAGVWQITRQTLRGVHRLYLNDKRDYSRLPERLRPPRELNVNDVSPDILTTYAGLLLRHLLDFFNGDVALAVGAYNGGPARPNMRYQEGVQAAALHARTVLEHAAVLNGDSVMRRTWLRPRP